MKLIGFKPPVLQASNTSLDLILAAGKRKPHISVATIRVKIEPRRGRHVRFRQHKTTELCTVIGQLANISIDIECTVRRCQPVETRLWQLG